MLFSAPSLSAPKPRHNLPTSASRFQIRANPKSITAHPLCVHLSVSASDSIVRLCTRCATKHNPSASHRSQLCFHTTPPAAAPSSARCRCNHQPQRPHRTHITHPLQPPACGCSFCQNFSPRGASIPPRRPTAGDDLPASLLQLSTLRFAAIRDPAWWLSRSPGLSH